MSELLPITVVVPIRERQSSIPGAAEFYSTLPCRKIFADSSKHQYTNSSHVDSFEYHYYTPTPYIDKMHSVFSGIATPYVLEISDDDFVFKTAIAKCLRFLQANPSYVVCDGEYLQYVAGKLAPKYGIAHFLQLKAAFESTSPLERVAFWLQTFHPKNHAVAATKAALAVFKFIIDNPQLRPIGWIDRVYIIVAATFGNLKTLDTLYEVRTMMPRIAQRKGIINETQTGIDTSTLLDAEHLNPFVSILGPDATLDKVMAIFKKHFFEWPVKSRITKAISVHMHNPYFKDELEHIKRLAKRITER